MSDFGYAGKILRVDLSSGRITTLATSDYAHLYVGGRGIATRLYWDEVPSEAGALSPENALILASGPLAGVPLIGGSRLHICAKSPATTPEHFTFCNLGGDWAVRLKNAGFDVVLVRGAAPRPSYLLIEDGTCHIKDASEIWGRGAIEARKMLEREYGNGTSTVAIGPGGESMATMACLMASNDASGGGGMGAVMGSKKLKAILVKAPRNKTKAARPDALKELNGRFRELFTTPPVATAGGVALRIDDPRTRKSPCFGCIGDCLRRDYESKDGLKGKFMCQSATFYQPLAEQNYGPGYETPFLVNKLCDEAGLDTMSMGLVVLWLMRCARTGVLGDADTGLPLTKLGTLDFMEALIKQICSRQGLGALLAKGVDKAAAELGPKAVEKLMPFMSAAGLPNGIDARLYINVAMQLATEPKPPLGHTHELSRVVLKWVQWRRGDKGSYLSDEVFRRVAERCWGGEAAADFSTWEGKALAAKIMQDREYAQDCLVLCAFLWPMTDSAFSEDHMGDPSLESRFLSAVTGRDVDEAGLHAIGDRVFNLNRAVLVREGWRMQNDRLPAAWYTIPLKLDVTNPDMLVPGKAGEVVSRKGQVVEVEAFEAARKEYYQLRGWDPSTGLQKAAELNRLGLADVATDLRERSLAT